MTIGQVHSSATCHMSSLWLNWSFFLRPSGVARILGLRMLAHNLAFDIASLLADGAKVRSCWVSAKKGTPNQFPTKDTLLISYISLFLGWQGQIFEIRWLYLDSSNMEPDWKTNPYCRTIQKSLQPLLHFIGFHLASLITRGLLIATRDSDLLGQCAHPGGWCSVMNAGGMIKGCNHYEGAGMDPS